jgi:hypothetical protein
LSRCFDRLLTFTLSSSRDQEHAQLQAEATQSKTESSNVLPDIESIAKKAQPKAASRGPPSAAAAAAAAPPPSITAASPVGSAGGIGGGGASKNRRSSRDRISLAPIHTPQQASSQRQVLAKQASAIAASEGVAALTDDDVNSILGSLFLDQK